MNTTKLQKLCACWEAIDYVQTQRSPSLAWKNCPRGDWMLWISKRLGVDDRKLTLAKATIVKQVEHLLIDQRSIDALAACFRYTNGEITSEELNVFATNASYAADDAAEDDDAYAYATAAVYFAAYASVVHADDAATYTAYAAATTSTREESLKKSADICREILTDEVLLKYKRLK